MGHEFSLRLLPGGNKVPGTLDWRFYISRPMSQVDLFSFTVIFISAVSNSMGRKVKQIAQILQVKSSQKVE